jgi:hypothetical protein
MAWQPLNGARPRPPAADAGDEPPTALGSYSRGQTTAFQSTSTHNTRPRQPSTLSPDAETPTSDRPIKRRRTANDLASSRRAAMGGDSSPLFFPDDVPSPIMIDLSGPSPRTSVDTRREIAAPQTNRPIESPVPVALWNTDSPGSATTPSSGSRGSRNSQPIEIDLVDDDSELIMLDDDDDDDVVVVGGASRAAADNVVVIDLSTANTDVGAQTAGRAATPPSPAMRGLSLSDAATLVGLSLPLPQARVDTQRTRQPLHVRQELQQQAQQRQRLELQQRQQQKKTAPPVPPPPQEDAVDGPPTLKRLTCVICMDVPTDLTAASCGRPILLLLCLY